MRRLQLDLPASRWLGAILPAVLLPWAAQAWAAGGPAVWHVNEIWPQSFSGPQDGFLKASVELYNPGPGSLDAAGLVLANGAGTIVAAVPVSPSRNVPPQGFLTVVFGTGLDDSDFGDGAGTYHTQGDSLDIFDAGSDECALYQGVVIPAAIVDYVAWSRVGPYAGGFSAGAAQAAGRWTAGDYVDLAGYSILSSLGLAPDGFDHEVASDWRQYDWGTYFVGGGGTTVQNALQSAPLHGGLLESASPNLIWAGGAAADSFHIDVDDDSTFATVEIAVDTTSTSLAIDASLPDGVYFWRVRVYSGGSLVPEHAVWAFMKLWSMSIPKAGDGGRHRLGAVVPNLTPLVQHKDTRMLCIYNPNPNPNPNRSGRPGCDQRANQPHGPWDNAHAVTAAHVTNCAHCSWYCTRAVIAMVNNRYGGNLSQDRVAYQLFPGAENGLGHDSGTFLNQRFPVYAWALGVAQNQIARNAGARPPWATIKAEVDAGRPIYIDGRNHATLLYGYLEIPLFVTTLRLVFIANPWPGTAAVFRYENWQPDGAGWLAAGYFLLPAAGIAAVNQEPGVTADADADTVVNFDETTRLCSLQNQPDTDRDQIGDYREILSYTFHSRQHNHNTNAIGFSDLDGDNLRTECDCDGDADGDYDGGEDINSNGTNPEAGETDVYRSTSSQLALTITPVACGLGQFEPQPSGGTLHANDTFGVDLRAMNPCQPPARGEALGVAGLVSTDASGNISIWQLPCVAPGTYRMVFDAIPNGTFDPGCDPVVCFTIDPPVAVEVESFAATSVEGRVRLAWRLSAEATATVAGVRVERADAAEGPWAARLESPLAPRSEMTFLDEEVEAGHDYWYRLVLEPRDGAAIFAGPVAVTVMGGRFETALYAPSAPAAGAAVEIRYGIGRSGIPVRLELLDVQGRRIRSLVDGPHAAGLFTARWDRRDGRGVAVARGVYLVRLAAGDRELARKIVLAD